MKEQLYIIKTRYEYRSADGIDWTDWFVLERTQFTEQDANQHIADTKKLYGDIDKKTKLRHEYMIVPVEEFEKELAETNKIIEEGHVRDEAYFASDKWKELKHKKYVARKERKAKQEEYLKMQEQLNK